MAVVARKRKHRVVYFVCTSYQRDGRKAQHWEKSGTDRRQAETLDRQRRKEVRDKVFRPGRITERASFAAFAENWLRERTNRSADNDRGLLEKHVLSRPWLSTMTMGDIRPKHLIRLIGELNETHLAVKSVSLVMGILRVLFRDAVIGETISETPYVIPRGLLRRSGTKRQPYTAQEATALLGVPDARLATWNAVALFTGARCGEINGLRWGDWDQAAEPLGALVIERQYDGQPLKTERPRIVPVHPWLKLQLEAWREHWKALYCREPAPGNLIFPGEGHTALTKSSAYKAWRRSCVAASVGNRSLHSTRHTFITLARRAGADKNVLELITHNPKGTIIDRYTTRDWAELCKVVSLVDLPLEIDDSVSRDDGSPLDVGSSSWTRTRTTDGNSDKDTSVDSSSDGEPPGESRDFSGNAAEIDASQEIRGFRLKASLWFRRGRVAA
jgi:integrase